MIPLAELDLRPVRWMRDTRRASRMALYEQARRVRGRINRQWFRSMLAPSMWFIGIE